MNKGILTNKVIKHPHCGEFILCLMYYVLSIRSCMGIIITNTHCFQSIVWLFYSACVRSISTGHDSKYFGMDRGGD